MRTRKTLKKSPFVTQLPAKIVGRQMRVPVSPPPTPLKFLGAENVTQRCKAAKEFFDREPREICERNSKSCPRIQRISRFGFFRQAMAQPSSRGLEQSKTLRVFVAGLSRGASWSAAVLCRFLWRTKVEGAKSCSGGL